ncbi:GGDEF domain-containing protein [Propionivibrio limicola]|uniref:GGDEF domain-containing protein n=1 Tax=Propionivibrio limicola TaxID=167645 RepID=UPI001478D616|nr:GGDEF domain-containing protein [Propionivibrio limicola]
MAIYAVFAALWILLSDKAVGWLFREPDTITLLSLLKGWFFVGVTSLMLYVLVRRLIEQALAHSAREQAALTEKQRTHQLLAAIVDSSSDAVFAKDLEGRYILFNRETARVTGKTPEEALGHDDRALFPAQQAELIRANDRRVIAENRINTYEEKLDTVDGERIFLATKGPLCDAEGRLFGMYGISRDITERKQMEEQIREMAFFDPLTQLPNRHLLNDRLLQTMLTSKRTGFYGALMFLDLDNFKPLNDTHGHAVGDLLLLDVAVRLKKCVREMDTVARFGGDEFVVILNDLDTDRDVSVEKAHAVAEKIRASLSEPYRLFVQRGEGERFVIEHHCTVSIGVFVFINHDATPDDILKWADAAMYEAKDAGRNVVRFYSPSA